MNIDRVDIQVVQGRIRIKRWDRAARGAKVLVASGELVPGVKVSDTVDALTTQGILPKARAPKGA